MPALPNAAWWTTGRAALASAITTAALIILLFTMLVLLLPGEPQVFVEVDLPDEPLAASPLPVTAGVDGGIVVQAYTEASFAGLSVLPAAAPGEALTPAPDPALIEVTPAGELPRIAADGREPRQAYARPFDKRDDRARLVIIVLNVGLSRAASEASIHRLPGAVVMAIDPYAVLPEDWARTARQAGHEIIATISLQAATESGEDAGPRALLATADAQENVQRLVAGLGRFTGYTGVLLRGGAAFGDSIGRLEPLLRLLRARGLLLVDSTTTGGSTSPLVSMAGELGLPHVRLDVAIDAVDATGIDRQLEALATVARERSVAVGAIQPTPVALERLRAFLAALRAWQFQLAPVSAAVAGGEMGERRN
ncbi:MAG: divergent polysaccharide deacetylase family protein [Rhodospirillales bacterium]|nr:divergent polysaccharide deacetylase family protein [Rhodospirillales bacterium]